MGIHVSEVLVLSPFHTIAFRAIVGGKATATCTLTVVQAAEYTGVLYAGYTDGIYTTGYSYRSTITGYSCIYNGIYDGIYWGTIRDIQEYLCPVSHPR